MKTLLLTFWLSVLAFVSNAQVADPLKYRHETMNQLVTNAPLSDLRAKFNLASNLTTNEVRSVLASDISKKTNSVQINQFLSQFSTNEVAVARKQVLNRYVKRPQD